MKSFLKYWLPVLIWLGLIFVGSTDLMSAEHTSRIIGPILRWFNPDVSIQTIAQIQFFVRKVGHVTEYAILAILVWRGFRGGTRRQTKMSILFGVTWFVCALFAASDEFHQSFVPSRTASLIDVVIDVLGALIGLTICVAVARRKVVSKTLLITALLWFSLARSHAEDYAARFKELESQKAPGAQVDSLLDEWRAKQPNDPDAWITSANYYFNQSVGANISTKKPEKGDFKLTDKKTGKQSGSISFKPGVVQTSRQADELLTEATGKFPDRLDIWCGLAFMYQEGGDFDNELATLKKMVVYAREHPTGLKWLKGESIDESADKFVPEKLHSYGMYYEKKDTPEDDQRFLKIAMFSTEQYPNHPFAFNDVALYYSNTGDKKKTREWLEKAHQVDPKDGLIMYNLGKISAEAGDKGAARKWFEESLKADPDGDHVEAAKDALKKLKK